MSDREFLRRMLFAVACLTLAACKEAPLLCDEQDPCPSSYVCDKGVCVSPDVSCPEQPPLDETIIAPEALSCSYGEECCCGKCYPKIMCTAQAGEEIGCFYTEACMNPSCT